MHFLFLLFKNLTALIQSRKKLVGTVAGSETKSAKPGVVLLLVNKVECICILLSLESTLTAVNSEGFYMQL